MSQETKNRILEYVKEQFGAETNHYSYCSFPEHECICNRDIDENTKLISGGYVDSFSMVRILVWIEKTYNIKIPEKLATAENFDTVNKIAELI